MFSRDGEYQITHDEECSMKIDYSDLSVNEYSPEYYQHDYCFTDGIWFIFCLIMFYSKMYDVSFDRYVNIQ